MTTITEKRNQRSLFSKAGAPLSALKKKLSDPKVKKIALEVLKTLGIALLAAGFCALSFASMGLAWLIGGTVAGALTGGIAYAAIRGVYLTVRKEGFPSYRFKTATPIDRETWLGDEQKKEFTELLQQEFKGKEWFETWKGLHAFRSGEATERYLWHQLQKSVQQGEAMAMLIAAKEHGKFKKGRFLQKVAAEEVFKYQLLSLIKNDFNRFADDTNADLVEHLLKTPGVGIHRGAAFELEIGHVDLFVKTLKEHVFEADMPLRAALSPELALDHPYESALIYLHSKKKAPPLFVQIKPDMRFYDSCHKRFSGLHEGFTTQEEFAKALFHHLKGYQSNLRPQSPKFNKVLVELYY